MFNAVLVLALIFLSFFLYFGSFARAVSFNAERIGNVILIFVCIFLLMYITDVVGYRPFLNKEYDLAREIASIVGKLLIIILIVSFVEFFVFYTTKIGRVVYVNMYLLLSVCSVGQSLVFNLLILRIRQKILWLSTVPCNRVEREYLEGYSLREKTDMHSKAKNTNYDFVIYDYPPKNTKSLKNIFDTIITAKNPIDLVSFVEELAERIPLHYVDQMWLLKNIRTYENLYDKLRRVFNFFGSLILLIVLFPASFLFSLAHRIESKGPLFYIQTRVGYFGNEFRLIKYRTMVTDAEKDGPRFTSRHDPRITRVGRAMRGFRIDEVPQLLNVLKGDMNLIGPRPERGDFISMLEEKIPYYKLRLKVRPGLTGWAQVNYPYAGENIEEHLKKLEFDLYYIKNRGLALDLLILYKTLMTIVRKKGT